MLQIDLSQRIAVVTGGSGELGRVIVRVLARCGADVAIHYFRQAERAYALLEELQALGVRGMTVQADVTQPESVSVMHEAIVHTLGPPHILVTNAVIQYSPWTTVLQQPLADYESQLRSSVLQNVLMAKAFVPEMIHNRYGRFIAISTECVMQSLPGQSAYIAGKRGMDGVLRVLAKEIGP
jgi:3-oxoacyl-[acyl-carrier protein] reductase